MAQKQEIQDLLAQIESLMQDSLQIENPE